MKNFAIPFYKAKALGITDEDLIYISEIGTDKYRISIRLSDGTRYTRHIDGLLNAINHKWEKIEELEEKSNLLQDATLDINLFDLTLQEGFEYFFSYRDSLVRSELLELTSYEKDVITLQSRLLRNHEILDKKITEIDLNVAQSFVNSLYEIKSVKKDNLGKKLSINTIYRPFDLLHKSFNYFKEELKIIKENPFNKVKNKPKYIPQDQKYLVTEEIKIVLNKLEFENIRFKTFLNLHLESGLRIEEITAIKWSDIDKLRSTLRIVRALVKSKLTNELIVKSLKTKGSTREISVSLYVLDLFDKYRKFKEDCGIVIDEDDFVFTGWETNELISPSTYSTEFKNWIRKIGFDVALRNIRHTSATFMLQGITNIKAVQKRFGWSKNSTVMNIYNQSSLYEDRLLLAKFEDEFRNAFGLSFSDLYRISVGRFSNSRKLNRFVEDLSGISVADENFNNQVERCKDYLFEIFPVFNKIAKINETLDDEEIESIFIGFKDIYKSIKIEPLEKELQIRI